MSGKIDTRAAAVKIVQGLDAARKVSSQENPVDEVGLIEAALADLLDDAEFQISARDEEIKIYRELYQTPGRRKHRDVKLEKAREMLADGMSYREIAKALGYKSPSNIWKALNAGRTAP